MAIVFPPGAGVPYRYRIPFGTPYQTDEQKRTKAFWRVRYARESEEVQHEQA
jgi:hypothetical protein